MNISYASYTPDRNLLLAPSLQKCPPEGRSAYSICGTVNTLDLSTGHSRYAKGGLKNQIFHPGMMIKAPLHGCATGTLSSRRLAVKLYQDVTLRVLGVGNFPAHSTLSDFKTNYLEELSALFVQTFCLTSKCELVKLDAVAIDDKKAMANASRCKTMSYKQVLEAKARLAAQIKALINRATAVERDELELAILDEIARREKRLETIHAAKAQFKRRQTEIDRARGRRKNDERKPRGTNDTPKAGCSYAPDFGVLEDNAQENFTDPHSRTVKQSNVGFDQSHNGQTAVDGYNEIVWWPPGWFGLRRKLGSLSR